MDRMSYNLFATATLACDQHSRVGSCDSLDQQTQLYDSGMIANQSPCTRRL